MVHTLAQRVDVVALVGDDSEAAIHRWQATQPEPGVEFVLVPLSRLGRLAIRLASSVNDKFWWIAYLSWLKAARRTASRVHRETPFDGAVHAAYGAYWLPSPVTDLGLPSVWGPVGGATATHPSLTKFLGWKGILGEHWKRTIVKLGAALPATRRTWKRATVRLTETENTRRALPEDLRATTRVVNRGPLQRLPAIAQVPRGNYCLFPGLVEPRKGPRLALEALARTPAHVRLRFAADGYEVSDLRRLTQRLGISQRIEFLGQLPRQQMLEMMAGAAAVIFTGLREEGGCALSEAMQLGAPVIVVGHAGARVIAELGSDPERLVLVEPNDPDVVDRLAVAMQRFTDHPPAARAPYLDPASTEAAIHQALADALATRRHGLVGVPS